MRLMGPIMALLLAVTMAIFPISMLRAAAPGVHEHPVTLSADLEHLPTSGSEHASQTEVGSCDVPPVLADCGSHGPGSHDTSSPSCCGMGACHVFQVTLGADMHSPVLSSAPVGIPGDEQVVGVISGGIDRPPRSV